MIEYHFYIIVLNYRLVFIDFRSDLYGSILDLGGQFFCRIPVCFKINENIFVRLNFRLALSRIFNFRLGTTRLAQNSNLSKTQQINYLIYNWYRKKCVKQFTNKNFHSISIKILKLKKYHHFDIQHCMFYDLL